jgi:hypothetical protein
VSIGRHLHITQRVDTRRSAFVQERQELGSTECRIIDHFHVLDAMKKHRPGHRLAPR